MATKRLFTEDKADEIIEQLKIHNAYQAAIAADSVTNLKSDVTSIQSLVREGLAEQLFSIGDQIYVTYTYNSVEYSMPFDVVHFGDVELEDGETMPGMWLQSHYATIESLMFDGYEAFYYAEDGLEAGTYNVTFGTGYTYVTSGTSYQFTLTEDVPSGGVLAGFRRLIYDVSDVTTLYVYSYESTASSYDDYIEAVALSEGSEGTSLGTMYGNSNAANSGLNHIQRVCYGYNRWSQSAYRQWLNSSAVAGSWWEPQNTYDLAPSQSGSYAGFMAGFDDEFLGVLGNIKVTTALNTVEGLDDTSEDTYDTFFLPSLEQIYIVPQLSGVEGDYWEYWKRVTGATEPQASGTSNIYTERITYALNSQSSAQYVRLRSANRGLATHVWYVSSAGYVYSHYAYATYRCAPACVIC